MMRTLDANYQGAVVHVLCAGVLRSLHCPSAPLHTCCRFDFTATTTPSKTVVDDTTALVDELGMSDITMIYSCPSSEEVGRPCGQCGLGASRFASHSAS